MPCWFNPGLTPLCDFRIIGLGYIGFVRLKKREEFGPRLLLCFDYWWRLIQRCLSCTLPTLLGAMHLHSARPLVCTCESGPDDTLHDVFVRRTRDINRGCQSLKWRDYLFLRWFGVYLWPDAFALIKFTCFSLNLVTENEAWRTVVDKKHDV